MSNTRWAPTKLKICFWLWPSIGVIIPFINSRGPPRSNCRRFWVLGHTLNFKFPCENGPWKQPFRYLERWRFSIFHMGWFSSPLYTTSWGVFFENSLLKQSWQLLQSGHPKKLSFYRVKYFHCNRGEVFPSETHWFLGPISPLNPSWLSPGPRLEVGYVKILEILKNETSIFQDPFRSVHLEVWVSCSSSKS